MFARVVHLLFGFYKVMIFIKVIGSWFPEWRGHKFMLFVSYYTEPYLGFFRRFLPPLGGMIDLSPIVGFLVLQFAEQIILSLI